MPSLMRPSSRDLKSYLQYLFSRTERRLINEITRKLNSGYVDYAERAALKRVQETLKTMEDECFKYVPKMVREPFIKTNKDLYGYSNAEAIAGISEGQNKAIELLSDNLMGMIDEAAAQTYASTQELLTIGRLENDPFRTAGLAASSRAAALGTSSLTEVTSMVTELETKGITAFVDKAGRHWSLRDYGNMAVRTTARQAEVASVLTADDWDLWQIVKIGSTCPLCAVYEGRVYSKSGTNPNYPPLAMAFGKIDPAGGNDLANTYLNIHPNCLHTLIKFTEMGKSDKQLQKIREFSSPITNPLNVDPRTKKQKEAYETKVRNRARLLREMRKKQAEQLMAVSPVKGTSAGKATSVAVTAIQGAKTKQEAIDMLLNEVGIINVSEAAKRLNAGLFTDSANKLNELEKQFGIIHRSEVSIVSKPYGKKASAYTSSGLIDPTQMELSLCPQAYGKGKSRDTMTAQLLKERKSRHHMPFADGEATAYETAHEYGHMLQHYLRRLEMEKRGWSPGKAGAFINRTATSKEEKYKWYYDVFHSVQDQCYDEIVGIVKELDPSASVMELISKYGASDKGEFFAEAFANAVCGEPNLLGRAMDIFLRRKGLL